LESLSKNPQASVAFSRSRKVDPAQAETIPLIEEVCMSFSDRLGLAGVVLALIALAATYLWPDKKWIGWVALFCAVALLFTWGWLELGTELPRLRLQYPIKSTIVVFIVGGCLAVALWMLLQSTHKDQTKGFPVESPTTKPNLPVPASVTSPASSRSFAGREPKELLAFYQNVSPLQADDLMKPFMGQWIDVEGTVESNPVDAGHDTSQFILVDDGARCACTFAPQWRQDVKRVRIGNYVKAQCKISEGQNGGTLYLLDCDLLEQRAKSNDSHLPPIVPKLDKPIDVIDFNSIIALSVKNVSTNPIYIIDMQITQELETKYLDLGFDVPPQQTKKFPLKPDVNISLTSIPRLGETWKDHVHEVTKQYKSECLAYVYFSANDSGLAMVEEHYRTQQGTTLGKGEATAIIHYRLSNSSTNMEQTIPLAVTVMHNPSCHPTPPS